ncbi:hypothetical protein IPH25_01640 [bacterium]|nr:MAG: hypothetical protein IPG37_03770 [bacterium]QQR62129.1 MAG: hypothetical protein IPH25_01640 [bacterium]QQR63313.1 MAG: hypothetical protein IPH67_02470 [bacterium]
MTKKFSGRVIFRRRENPQAELADGNGAKNGLELALEYLNEKQKGWCVQEVSFFYSIRFLYKVPLKKTNPYFLITYILIIAVLSYLIKQEQIRIFMIGMYVSLYPLVLFIFYDYFKPDVIANLQFHSPLPYGACPLVLDLVKD